MALKRCSVCGGAFAAPPSGSITCSAACASEQKRRSHTGAPHPWSADAKAQLSTRGRTPNLTLGTPAARQSPIAGPFETNQEAKSWEIINLDSGQRYELRNLRKFCRDHPGLFVPDPWENAYAGLRQVQAWLTGKDRKSVV